jgi:replicative DNA helicase
MQEFKLAALTKYPEMDSFVQQIESTEIGEDVLEDQIKDLINRSLAYDLALEAISVSEGNKDFDSILTFIDKFNNKPKVEETEFISDNLEDLYNDTVLTQGLRWRLGSLNKSLGSLRQGDFGFVFARPETGKTTFLASEITYFAEQANGPVLWFNNEEQGNKVKIRTFQATLGVTLTELFANRQGNNELYLQRTHGNLKIYDSASINKRQIEHICRELNPKCIVIDQIDKLKGFEGDRNDLRLTSIYQWARELAKMYCPVIGVCQADVSGEGKKWLTMDNVAESKTGKQGEADFIIGIGKTHDLNFEHVRYLHLSKNKLSGDADTDPLLRHGRIEVLIRPEIARYEDF